MIRTRASTRASVRGIARMSHHEWSDTVKHVLDGLSVATAVGTITDMLPEVAAMFTIFWTGIRIYESATVQKLLGKDKKGTDSGE